MNHGDGDWRSDTERQKREPGIETKKGRHSIMKLNHVNLLFGEREDRKPPVLLAVTPPRTGERTLLGVENLLQSIAVPEPFSLELAGDVEGVTLMARCLDGEVVRQQISSHYPQARIHEVPPDEDPLRTGGGEQAWSMTLRADGPDYAPLRTFRDDDLLDPGSDPLIALLGALTALRPGERVVARLLLRSLGPDWSEAHMEKAHKRPGMEPREPAYTYQTKPLQTDGITLAVLGVAALAAIKGYLWVQAGEAWKAALLGAGASLGLAAAGWAWHRWKKARSRVYDPLLIKEKVSRVAFDAEIQVTAVTPQGTRPQRGRDLLDPVAAAYRHYDNPAGARIKVSKVRPAVPAASLHPAGAGLFGKRSVLGVREAAALWHPPGAGDETPLVERSGARALIPSARGVRGGAPVGDATAGNRRPIRFPEDLLRRHHLYVARTRMGKSTLMHHIVAHKMREKAEGRDGDAIVVVDPHADLVEGLLEQVPESLIDRVRLIDLADDARAPGINLLDTRIFSDRDRTADSVVRVARGLWEQWGPRMQSMPGVDYETMLSELGKFGASFILATQSLAKLDDLSPTMRDTLLANIGCLAVFQVSGSDARTLVWELGKDRVSEDDITSLPVHHCYVRATVGKERMPAFSMMVRKPEPGDPEAAARIRAAASSYTLSAWDVSDGDADGQKKVGDFQKGVEELRNGDGSPLKEKGDASEDRERWRQLGKRDSAAGDAGQDAADEERDE